MINYKEPFIDDGKPYTKEENINKKGRDDAKVITWQHQTKNLLVRDQQSQQHSIRYTQQNLMLAEAKTAAEKQISR